MNEGPHGSSLLLKIAYGQTPPFQDLPRQGLINQPCMWRFEQKMTIQTLMHFLQQEDGEGTGNPYPILLELLSKVCWGNISPPPKHTQALSRFSLVGDRGALE